MHLKLRKGFCDFDSPAIWARFEGISNRFEISKCRELCTLYGNIACTSIQWYPRIQLLHEHTFAVNSPAFALWHPGHSCPSPPLMFMAERDVAVAVGFLNTHCPSYYAVIPSSASTGEENVSTLRLFALYDWSLFERFCKSDSNRDRHPFATGDYRVRYFELLELQEPSDAG